MLKFLSLILILALISCGDSNKEKAMTVIFTCDTQGRLEPCGCFAGQYGGLSRISTAVAQFDDEIVLKFDAGDASPGEEDYNRILYAYVQQAFKKMGYDAMNIGAREATLSLTHLEEINRKIGPPLISANLLNKKTGEAVFNKVLFFEKNGLKIAVTGVVDPLLLGESLGEGLGICDMESALSPLIKEMQQADMRVLLAFCDEAKMKKLADKFFEFDVILGGKATQPSQKLIRQNRSVILYTTNQAKNVGYLQGTFTPGEGLSEGDYDIPLLFEDVPEDPQILALAKKYRDEIRQTKLAVDSN
ncbi:MAG: hypothetical protein HRT88_02600, partial [Lentisphaeraceae bacterium]|nr:hypothetical protein [Lentisphaeraceae bacterium]